MRRNYALGNKVCSEICETQALLCDDVPFNLVPLEGMLKDTFKIYSTTFDSGKKAVSCF